MTTDSAETILQSLQGVLAEAARAVESDGPSGPPSPAALRRVERSLGVRATHYGRVLSDLVAGSHAWDLFEDAQSDAPGPRVYELCRCEPLLRAMRDSGELDERERLLRERDARFVSLWQDSMLSEEERRGETEALHARYQTDVKRLALLFRPRYVEMRRAAMDRILPLAAPRVHSRPLLQPPLMALLFSACHADKPGGFVPFATSGTAGLELRRRADAVQIGRRASPGTEAIQAWVSDGVQGDLANLDEMAWDVAAIAISAFFARTSGQRGDESFPFLLDDYFDWRGVDPRKRSAELRRQIAARIELLCSDRVQVTSRTDLWITDAASGRRRKTPVQSQGPFLVNRARLNFAESRVPTDVPDGYRLSLGEWAFRLVEERAMRGVFCRCLAEYDLRRQQWERRIGWYLVFQFNNQGSRMTFQDVVKDGRERTLVTPQHPLKMRTILTQSHVPWETTARTNPGKVIRQWTDALAQLRKDGLLGEYACLDGAPDGSDLPARGRLDALLERRFRLVPGRLLVSHLRSKKRAATSRSRPAR